MKFSGISTGSAENDTLCLKGWEERGSLGLYLSWLSLLPLRLYGVIDFWFFSSSDWHLMQYRTPGMALRRASGIASLHSSQWVKLSPPGNRLLANWIADSTVASICSCTAPSRDQPTAITYSLYSWWVIVRLYGNLHLFKISFNWQFRHWQFRKAPANIWLSSYGWLVRSEFFQAWRIVWKPP